MSAASSSTAAPSPPRAVCVYLTPGFNLLATVAFLDPFRVANYLNGAPLYRWRLMSQSGGALRASNGVELVTERFEPAAAADLFFVSSSWTPEAHRHPPLFVALRQAQKCGALVGGLDTGAFLLGDAGLLKGRRATVHYEHIDAFTELFPDTIVTEDLFVLDDGVASCCGGGASLDLALHLLSQHHGLERANAAARYLFHQRLRAGEDGQGQLAAEPVGARAPAKLRAAIRLMERHLEEPLAIPRLAAEVGLSQRRLERLFRASVKASAARYYRDIRLDRGRGLVTQTELSAREIALACGFGSRESFARAYRQRFGLSPRSDRVQGRVPFAYRAWPMHAPDPDAGASPASVENCNDHVDFGHKSRRHSRQS